MINMKVYVELNNDNTLKAYATYNVNGSFIEVEQDDITFNVSKIEGYYVLFKDGENHLLYDEEKYNNYVNSQIEQQELGNAMSLQSQLLQTMVLNNVTDEQAYIMKSLYSNWSGENIEYKKDEKVQYNNKLYKVIQNHTSQFGWAPDTQKSLFVEIAPSEIEYPDFRQPTMSEDAYNIGDKITYNGKKYISIINANVWSPDDYPSGWKLIEESTESVEPEEPIENEYPEFIQPTGAHDAYAKVDKVAFEGKKYVSLINANVYSPTAYPAGWNLVE